jgi:hypothetical protein
LLFGVRDGQRVQRMDLDEIGRRLKGALDDLAAHWWPEKRGVRAMRMADAVPTADPEQRAGKSGRKVIDTDVVAHAFHRRR